MLILAEGSIPMKHFQNDMWQRKHLTGHQRLESIRFSIGLLVTILVIAVAIYFALFPNPLWQ
jgi:hypothetical protein